MSRNKEQFPHKEVRSSRHSGDGQQEPMKGSHKVKKKNQVSQTNGEG